MNEQIEKAVSILNKGGIIIFPTDTAFGIGCRIDKKESIEKLFKIRNRPENQATPVLVSSLGMVKEYSLQIPKYAEMLMNKFWPGALTLVVNAKVSKIPKLVRGGTKTVGLRIPNNKTILEIIKKTGVPILGPSANLHGEKTPYSLTDVSEELIKKVDFVVDGQCSVKKASTVIDVTVSPSRLIREGAIKFNSLPKEEEKVLLINTSESSQAEVALRINGKTKKIRKTLTATKREIVLSLIDEILNKEGLEPQDLSAIEVVRGPGSFTGLRVGISIANAFSHLLNIPVNNKKIGDLENAVYN